MFPETCRLYDKVCKGDPDNCTLSPETLHHALQRQQERDKLTAAAGKGQGRDALSSKHAVLSTLPSPLCIS